MLTDFYVPRHTSVHAVPAGWKLGVLMAVSLMLFVLPSIWAVACVVGGAVVLSRVAQIPGFVFWKMAKPAIALLSAIFVLQWWWQDVMSAALIAGRLLGILLLANVMTCSTRVSDLTAALERGLAPLSKLGINVAQASLAFALTFRFLPLIAQIVATSLDAQRARGARGWRDYSMAPVIVHVLKMADDIAQAMSARQGYAEMHQSDLGHFGKNSEFGERQSD